jgi:membrane protein DedA with SNARE-associated domain
MSPLAFATLNVIGTVGRLMLLQLVGDVFSGPIDWFLGLVSDYRIPLLVISTVIVVVMASGELRRGRRDIEELEQLEPEHGIEPGDLDGDPDGSEA